MKQYNNLFIQLIFFSIVFAILGQAVTAQTFAASPITVTFGGNNNSPLFNLTNMAPGNSTTKTITVTNSDGSNRIIGIRGIVTNQTGNIADVMHLQITNNGVVLYGANNAKTLTQFFADSNNGNFIQLTTIQPHQSTTYAMLATFDQSAGNQYQGKSIGFSLTIGSDIAAVPTQIPTQIPTPTKIPTPTPTPRPINTIQQILSLYVQLFKNLFPILKNK